MDAETRQKVLGLLNSAARLVVKVGSAVLTTDTGLDREAVERLARDLAAVHDRGLDVVLVTAGAVAAGRKALSERLGLVGVAEDLPGKQAASAIGQGRLMHEYDQALAGLGKVSAQILLTREGLKNRTRFLNARNTLSRLLSWRVIPIINENDTVAVEELTFGDNDTLASLTVDLVGADILINLTSAGGVFERNPGLDPAAGLLPVITDIAGLDIDALCQGKTSTGSGGMRSKLLAARRVAQLGVPTLIASGRGGPGLTAILDGEQAGTWILPEERVVSHRKFWLAYHAEPAGDVWVDDGAARALENKGKSLLPIGVSRVEGRFGPGDLVRIKAQNGRTVGVGLCNYSAEDLDRIKGKKTSEIADILGRDAYAEAVHRDNLLLDPAI
ncbi:MAG: glutamate 5-kinase [Desulfovibrionaceae bacterium]|nr:glutamate 5-kinase [Desulfovibrionaceae bacterium]